MLSASETTVIRWWLQRLAMKCSEFRCEYANPSSCFGQILFLSQGLYYLPSSQQTSNLVFRFPEWIGLHTLYYIRH